MDIVKALRDYVTKFVTDTPGIKALLLDADTTQILGLVYSQSDIISKEVLLVEALGKSSTRMKHMNAIVFCRPTTESIRKLVDELRDPKYNEYYIYFSNIVRSNVIEQLAEADQTAVVKEVQEFYADVFPLGPELFSLNMANVIADQLNHWDTVKFERTCEGLVSVLLALKKRPVIRYEKNSEMARRLAKEVHYVMSQESSLFDFRMPDSPPLLLILDRRNDPVTPLLNQWTYQAMTHELVSIHNNLVSNVAFSDKDKNELPEIVLSPEHDPFFASNMYQNFGDLGVSVRDYVNEYQQKTNTNKKLESIEDMKRFMQEMPEFRRLGGNVSKHVSLMAHLSRLVDDEVLLEVSEVEQELAAVEDHSAAIQNVHRILDNPKVSEHNKIRVVLLYSLRYERHANYDIASVIDKLTAIGVRTDLVALVASLNRYAGTSQRQGDLFLNESMLSKSKAMLKKGLKGVENVFTQHTPLLFRSLELILKTKTKERDILFPMIENNPRDRPQEIIIFIVGGATYEESKLIAQLNQTWQGMRFLLGGTTVHNSHSFLRELSDTMSRIR